MLATFIASVLGGFLIAGGPVTNSCNLSVKTLSHQQNTRSPSGVAVQTVGQLQFERLPPTKASRRPTIERLPSPTGAPQKPVNVPKSPKPSSAQTLPKPPAGLKVGTVPLQRGSTLEANSRERSQQLAEEPKKPAHELTPFALEPTPEPEPTELQTLAKPQLTEDESPSRPIRIPLEPAADEPLVLKPSLEPSAVAASKPAHAIADVQPSIAEPTEPTLPSLTLESAEPELSSIAAPGPVLVRSLDLRASEKLTRPADNDHERLVAENMRVSPLSGVHDFEEPMDVDSLSDLEASDQPLTDDELAMLELSPEVRGQAERMLLDAVRLADRGAVYAAKRQFLRVLRMVTQSLDAKIGRSYHSRCLARGLRALDEADDFASQTKCVEADSDLEGFIAGHQTNVLHGVDASKLTPLIAMRHYYDYAHGQLTQSGGQSAIASKALFAMGRADVLISKSSSKTNSSPKSLAYYNAALAVDANNAQAANELAVMLASTGHLKHAATVLERSTSVAPSSIGLQNLSRIYAQLGKTGQARQIATTHQQLTATPGALTPTAGQRHQQIVWVSPNTFNDTASAIDADDVAKSSTQTKVVPATRTAQPTPPRPTPPQTQTNWW